MIAVDTNILVYAHREDSLENLDVLQKIKSGFKHLCGLYDLAALPHAITFLTRKLLGYIKNCGGV